MKTVRDILKNKPEAVYSVSPGTSVYQALEQMMEKNISALLVLEDKQLKGIFTERDYARKIILQGRSSKDTFVEEVMTADLLTVSLNDKIDHCMKIMTDSHIRHLPVVDANEIKGMVSIGDVVKNIIESQRTTIQMLENYINS